MLATANKMKSATFFTYRKATRCDTLYVAIFCLWKRIDEIGADQNTTDDALDLALAIFFFQAAKRTF